MPFTFNFQDQPGDRDLLESFFRQLERFLSLLCYEPQQYLGSGSYIEGGQQILQSMWPETQPDFRRAHVQVREVNLDRLAQAGLTGNSLKGKLAVVAQWAQRLLTSPGVGLLRKILGAINTLLGSFVQATGVGELIKELKETSENVIDDVIR